MSIPGVKQRTAEVLIAEIGTDMTVFPVEQLGDASAVVPDCAISSPSVRERACGVRAAMTG